jgi:beta-1,4-mannosyl-glycoprotein beta-1,4-N-acetylglucosaminyltransferase
MLPAPGGPAPAAGGAPRTFEAFKTARAARRCVSLASSCAADACGDAAAGAGGGAAAGAARRRRSWLLPAAAAVLAVAAGVFAYRRLSRDAIAERRNAYIVHTGWAGPGSCEAHGFTPRDTPARVFDVIMFNREWEVLELRLHELSPVVDAFIIVESDVSHAGDPKPLHFWDNRARFAPFLDRVVHVVHRGNETTPYARERAQRVQGFAEGVRRAGVSAGDLVIVADGDEIPRAAVLDTLRRCGGYPRNLCLASRSYYLSFEFQHTTYWHYPNVVTFDPADGTPLGDFRTDVGVCVADAGWHCSFCFQDADRVLNKLASTMHVADGVNSPARRAAAADYDALYQAYCDGGDPLGGAWRRYEVQASTVGLPAHVLAHADRFRWLLPGRCRTGGGQGVGMEPGTGVRAWDGAPWWHAQGRGVVEGG